MMQPEANKPEAVDRRLTLDVGDKRHVRDRLVKYQEILRDNTSQNFPMSVIKNIACIW